MTPLSAIRNNKPTTNAARVDIEARGGHHPGFGCRPRQRVLHQARMAARDGKYEPTAPKHHWSGWYAAYMVARQKGKTPEEAAEKGKLNIEGALAA
jgi:hypothetical protein